MPGGGRGAKRKGCGPKQALPLAHSPITTTPPTMPPTMAPMGAELLLLLLGGGGGAREGPGGEGAMQTPIGLPELSLGVCVWYRGPTGACGVEMRSGGAGSRGSARYNSGGGGYGWGGARVAGWHVQSRAGGLGPAAEGRPPMHTKGRRRHNYKA